MTIETDTVVMKAQESTVAGGARGFAAFMRSGYEDADREMVAKKFEFLADKIEAYEQSKEVTEPTDCREAFEAWWKTQIYGEKSPEDYVCESAAWGGWQAALNTRAKCKPDGNAVERVKDVLKPMISGFAARWKDAPIWETGNYESILDGATEAITRAAITTILSH